MAKTPASLTREKLTTPRAVAIAGILFALLYGTGIVLIYSLWVTLIFPGWVLAVSVYYLFLNLRDQLHALSEI